jgi:hypothetical protein
MRGCGFDIDDITPSGYELRRIVLAGRLWSIRRFRFESRRKSRGAGNEGKSTCAQHGVGTVRPIDSLALTLCPTVAAALKGQPSRALYVADYFRTSKVEPKSGSLSLRRTRPRSGFGQAWNPRKPKNMAEPTGVPRGKSGVRASTSRAKSHNT